MSSASPQARTDVRANSMIPPFAKGGRKGGATCNLQGLKGVFQTTVQVAGETITVRGNVVGGQALIGTAFK